MHPSDFDKMAIRTVIASQLKALQKKDGPEALSYTTPARQRFGSGEQFLSMVQQGFPQLCTPRETEFGDFIFFQGHWAQQVTVTGVDGTALSTLYVMQRVPDGTWRIDRCVFSQPPKALEASQSFN